MCGKDDGMYSFFKARSAYFPDRTLISFYGAEIGCRDFCSAVERHSGWLARCGLKKGDVATICLPNVPAAFIAFYALNNLGVTVSVVHPLTPPDGLAEKLGFTASKLVYMLDVFYPEYESALKSCGAKVIICRAGDGLAGLKGGLIGLYRNYFCPTKGATLFKKAFAEPFFGKSDGKSDAVYLHSAGTTGEPKTVVLSNTALNNLALNMFEVIAERDSDIVADGDGMLAVLPLFHIFGLGICMHTALCAGCRATLMPYFDARRANRLLKKENVNFISGIPSMYDKMSRERGFCGAHLKRLKYCFVGGDALTKAVKTRFDETVARFGGGATLSEGYGLSEATVCSVNTADENRDGSLGRAKGDNRFAVEGADGFLPDGEIGEICVSGGSLMSRYLDSPDTTAQVMFEDADGTLWLRTGDLGCLKDGYLFFKGRKKRLIKISGINVFPKEIEDTALATGLIADCCAVEGKSEDGKRIIKLFAVLKDGIKESAARDIADAIKRRLIKYDMPSEIIFLDALPKNSVFKTDYKALENM